MSVFKANDVRGIYGEELTDALAYRIGKATALFFKSKEIVVGRDARTSSPALHEALVQGIRDSGVGVLDLGFVDSPAIYFATGYLKMPGIMVTASHNPKEWNGFYICGKDAEAIYENNGLKKIEQITWATKTLARAKREGSLRELDLSNEYAKHILSFVDVKKLNVHIVIDAGNGMSAWSIPLVYPKTPVKYRVLYGKLDGEFPNHGPNPAEDHNLKALGREVVRRKAQFGIAFDGDADRMALVDERGVPIEGSIVGALLARYVLKKQKSGKVVYSSTCSHSLIDAIKVAGGKPVRDHVGHSYIQARMQRERALLGVEDTGHYFHQKNYYADSGLISSLIVCELYAEQGKKMSQLVTELTKYHKVEEVTFKLKNVGDLIKQVERVYRSDKPQRIYTNDGLVIEFPDYWFSVRLSHTEPVVRLNLEAHTEEGAHIQMKKLVRIVKKLIA